MTFGVRDTPPRPCIDLGSIMTLTQDITKTVAVVGAGRWGKNLVRNFHELKALHTVCDLDPKLLSLYQQQYPDIHVTTNFKSILENTSITQVAIATPTPTHYQYAKEAILAGKDVYVEKPLCLDFAEGEELVKLAEKQKRILMVGHILQYHPCIQKLQEMVARGDLGTIQYIAANRLNHGNVKLRENAIWDLATHDVSIILSLCDYQLPLQVRCMGGEYLSDGGADVAILSMEFRDNMRTHVYVSWLNPVKEHKFTVVGSKGTLVFDDTKVWAQKLTFFDTSEIWSHDQVTKEQHKEGRWIETDQKEPLRDECSHFLHCSVNRKTPKTNGQEGLTVLQVLQAAQESILEGGSAKDPSQSQPSFLVGT